MSTDISRAIASYERVRERAVDQWSAGDRRSGDEYEVTCYVSRTAAGQIPAEPDIYDLRDLLRGACEWPGTPDEWPDERAPRRIRVTIEVMP